MPKLFWLSLLPAIAGFAATPGKAADEPDLIFTERGGCEIQTLRNLIAVIIEQIRS
jgi:hypothetical protein